ncbi:histidine triad nucleotide-binding protein [Acetobacter senegalensis]|uniref:Histidine triad (HIT) protein n=1 Tax=Acetobacter senegalensis TaxID=446692 RepID=A0A0U5EY33_9PROT|nr:histidine triad nucleotide-binding protein [Acetobacter senegalensis]MCG4258125.1 histidine triad nucleotide-binding protein [Acetobacter senegalensis]MCG4260010.1 histidine triad nucleotide-binding protein [Acetobacter senegalensis]MCG4268052.1 histidine triad nucleotide-binding protein [Acetobacter senegalensis]MCP1197225.1 histidine triad nucleotide-binding protein [Acetobacter senegalensis]MPQ75190.1 HIT domain-containing protein [Acetobacter senegalensis]
MAVNGTGPYNSDNIFAKILRGDIPCKKVFENEWVLAFHDIAPKAPVHIIVIPKQPYVSFIDFSKNATTEEIAAVMRSTGQVAAALNLEESGYRVITNAGQNAGQEVPHFHLHVLGGKALPPFPV